VLTRFISVMTPKTVAFPVPPLRHNNTNSSEQSSWVRASGFDRCPLGQWSPYRLDPYRIATWPPSPNGEHSSSRCAGKELQSDDHFACYSN